MGKTHYILLLTILAGVFCGQFARAQSIIPELHEALANCKTDETEKRINILNDLTWEYTYSNTDTAFYFGFQALNLAETYKNDFPNSVSNTYGTVAILYDINGDNERALDLYVKSLHMKESLEDSSGIANAKTNIGALFFTQEDYAKALPYFNDALEIEIALKDTLSQIGSLINISVILKNQNQFKEAKSAIKRALELSKNLQDNYYEGQIFNNMGAQFLATSDLDSALHYFEAGATANLSSGNNYLLSISYENQANILMRMGKTEAALEFGSKALHLASEGQYYLLKTNAFETMYEIHLSAKNMDSAFIYKSKYELLNDSILKKENKQIVDEIEAMYNLQRKQTEILEKENEIERAKKTSIIYLLSAIGGGALTVILVILFWIKIRSNKKLEEKNEIIQLSLEEKEVLMREIHHRVKNNIQAIKSIISIQKRKTKSEETRDSLTETMNRVNAMAIIHNRLYRQTNLSGLTSDIYLSELYKDVLDSFGISNEEHKLNLELCPHVFQTDHLLTLGLIFNELITNACKYGKDSDGTLQLSVSSKMVDEKFCLQIWSSGNQNTPMKEGFGTELIAALVYKLKGEINYLSANGFKTELEIPINEE